MTKFYYYKKGNIESPYVVNYRHESIQWFKENNYQLIEYDNSGTKLRVCEP